jgi:hypothetical protein
MLPPAFPILLQFSLLGFYLPIIAAFPKKNLHKKPSAGKKAQRKNLKIFKNPQVPE